MTVDRARLRQLAATMLAIALLLASAWLAWDGTARRGAEQAGNEAIQAARESIVAILSYRPDTAEKDLDTAARERLTGPFFDDYTQLIRTVVIPDAKQRGHLGCSAGSRGCRGVGRSRPRGPARLRRSGHGGR